MLVVVSPAKRLDPDTAAGPETLPDFQREAGILASHVRQLTLKELRELMHISEDLARLNRDRFRDFDSDPVTQAARAAVFMFSGDTYAGLEPKSLEPEALQ
ncbi:MAG: YaaA family protein [Rhodobacteraceae bacterium]|nr:YaaA family protein [Paracoccaceae bacterium]